MATRQYLIKASRSLPSIFKIGESKNPFTSALHTEIALIERPRPFSPSLNSFLIIRGKVAYNIAFPTELITLVNKKIQTTFTTSQMLGTYYASYAFFSYRFYEEDYVGINRIRNIDNSEPATAILAPK